MKRYELKAYILHPMSDRAEAVPATSEHSAGRFVLYKDVQEIIKKSMYWEEQFRKEFRRVNELCEQRDKARQVLKKLQEDLL